MTEADQGPTDYRHYGWDSKPPGADTVLSDRIRAVLNRHRIPEHSYTGMQAGARRGLVYRMPLEALASEIHDAIRPELAELDRLRAQLEQPGRLGMAEARKPCIRYWTPREFYPHMRAGWYVLLPDTPEDVMPERFDTWQLARARVEQWYEEKEAQRRRVLEKIGRVSALLTASDHDGDVQQSTP